MFSVAARRKSQVRRSARTPTLIAHWEYFHSWSGRNRQGKITQSSDTTDWSIMRWLQENKMKSNLFSKCSGHWTAATFLLALASTSNCDSTTTKHRVPFGRKEVTFHLMIPLKNQTDGWYQPPRSPGYNEDFGG
jgi:hypothetical protein